MQRFKSECKNYLLTLGIGALRSYGRHVGVERPTTKNKEDLIEAIIGILAEEISPVPCSKLGAPVLNKHVDPNIIATVEKLRLMYVSEGVFSTKPDENGNYHFPKHDGWVKELGEMDKRKLMLELNDPNAAEYEGSTRKIHGGQLETLNSVTLLLPLNCSDSGEKIVVPIELIHEHDLHEGDVVTCYVQRGVNCAIAKEILTINGIELADFHRRSFDESEVVYPYQKIEVYDEKRFSATVLKFLQWILPLGKGQRGLITSVPKAGKTRFLQEVAKAATELNPKLRTIALLIDQSPEAVAEYRKTVKQNNLLYTTYDHDPGRQVFVAEYALKRAKAYAESGKDVLLVVDSFNALARAYNDTDASSGGKMLSCGLESKTVHYLKKYFGAARCFAKGGSLTILGAVSTLTGNPVDEYIATELLSLCNMEICLDETLAYKRIYPALDIVKSYAKQNEALLSEEEKRVVSYLCNEYVPRFGSERALRLIEGSGSYEEFKAQLFNS